MSGATANLFDPDYVSGSPQEPSPELHLLPPESLSISVWRSLWLNIRDRFSADNRPPLQLSSRPVEVGMLLGDVLALPWYRTVFANLGDVINPETLPPLVLESRPVEVDELLSDTLAQGWWGSLLRNLADDIAPEKLPPLHLTTAPIRIQGMSSMLLVPSWSSLAASPRYVLFDGPKLLNAKPPTQAPAPAHATGSRSLPAKRAPETAPSPAELLRGLQRAVRRAHGREFVWSS